MPASMVEPDLQSHFPLIVHSVWTVLMSPRWTSGPSPRGGPPVRESRSNKGIINTDPMNKHIIKEHLQALMNEIIQVLMKEEI
jgi:hypothetical protein